MLNHIFKFLRLSSWTRAKLGVWFALASRAQAFENVGVPSHVISNFYYLSFEAHKQFVIIMDKTKTNIAYSLVVEIINAAQIVDFTTEFNMISYLRFYYKDNSWILFSGKLNSNVYYKNLEKLYHLYNEIPKSLSTDEFKKNLNKLIKENIEDLSNLKENIDLFFSDIIKNPLEIFNIYKPIFGITLRNNKQPLKLGIFTIYHQPTFKHIVENHVRWNQEWKDTLWLGWSCEYFIHIETKARDSKKAESISEQLFYILELLVYFAKGSIKPDYGIHIITQSKSFQQNSIIFGKGTVSQPSSMKGSFIPLYLDDPYIQAEVNGNNKIWNFIGNNSLTELEQRLLESMQWLGRAHYETDTKTKFLEYMIAIESIFSVSEKVLISPSVASTIVDSLTLLLITDVNNRLNFEKIIKNLYGIRSAIAHGGLKDIDEKSISEISQIAESAVRIFLYDEYLSTLKSTQELIAYVKKLKYNIPP